MGLAAEIAASVPERLASAERPSLHSGIIGARNPLT
jgi:hypothetical protein